MTNRARVPVRRRRSLLALTAETTTIIATLVLACALGCGRLDFDRASPDTAAQGPTALELLTGDIGGPGNTDGAGAAAHFRTPVSVAVDSAGNVYVADAGNSTIRKITPDGVVTTLAGTPGIFDSADGSGAAARFSFPSGTAVDGAGNVYVADFGNDTIRKITPDGVVTTLAGTAGARGSANGIGAAARFNCPSGVAVDSNGNVYVADTENDTIRKITAAGVVTTLAGTAGVSGSADGTGAAARFSVPADVAVDSNGNVYVADPGNETIRKITPAGVVTTLTGTAGVFGSADGTGAAASFGFPRGLAVDGAGNVYVADTDNCTVRKVTPGGVVTTPAGTANMCGSADGIGGAARFSSLAGVTVDRTGNIYVADSGSSTIRKVTPDGVVTTLAGTTGIGGSADGIGDVARFSAPSGTAVDSAGNIYIADAQNSTIRKITPDGTVTTLAGTAGVSGSADGIGGAARFSFPSGVAVDSTGNVYVADSFNDTIRKITPDGIVTTLAGTARVFGGADGTGAAARFFEPFGVAVDRAGTIYVADGVNYTIRKVTPDGVVTTLAGTSGMGGSADGIGAAARFLGPHGVTVDSAGDVYVADADTIRKITPSGVVTTLAGTAGMGGSADGTGAAARFSGPSDVVLAVVDDGAGNGIAIDGAGNLYVADTGSSTIRKVTPTGDTTTVAGTAGVAGIVVGATPRFSSPTSLAVAGDSLVISDTNGILLLRHGARSPTM